MAEEEDDPLALKSLAVQFDYLMFKINDHYATLAEQTYSAVVAKRDTIEHSYLEQQLQVEKQIKDIDDLISSCEDLELEFKKLDQIEGFVEDFKTRLSSLEQAFNSL
ncbi:Biogenesis of lysosome-related organelles complex 1 subunit CNL1 [[Candida] zeylanoides]